MLIWLVACPILAAVVAFAAPSNRWRPWIVPLGAAVHAALTWYFANQADVSAFHHWLRLDPLGRVFLTYISLFFLICSLYAPAYLAFEPQRSNRVLCPCLLLALAMMTLVIISHHLGLMWIAIEATTLATAPCIYFHHNPQALEATWKYLLICSVGIGLALLGSFCLAYSSLFTGAPSTLLFDDLVRAAPRLSHPWLHLAFILTFVGYGTKMGLAPMHTWLPDAHSESPSMVSALLSGALLSCSFLAILRIYVVCGAAGEAMFAQRIMLVMGLVSMALAAVSVSRQRDIKRIVAYSSVEHMGMLIFGIGIGGQGVYGALLHVIHNGLTKGALFLAAGNIHQVFGSKETDQLRSVLRRLPFSGAMFLMGFFAITGAPPFAPFVSEFQILSAAFVSGHYFAGALFLLFLFLVFLGMGSTIVSISFGPASAPATDTHFRDSLGTSFPVLAFMALVLILGVYTPPLLTQWVSAAAAFVQMTP